MSRQWCAQVIFKILIIIWCDWKPDAGIIHTILDSFLHPHCVVCKGVTWVLWCQMFESCLTTVDEFMRTAWRYHRRACCAKLPAHPCRIDTHACQQCIWLCYSSMRASLRRSILRSPAEWDDTIMWPGQEDTWCVRSQTCAITVCHCCLFPRSAHGVFQAHIVFVSLCTCLQKWCLQRL